MSRHFYRPYRNISSSSSNWSQWSMPILVSYCFSILILGMQECFQRICHNKTIAQAKLLCNICIYGYGLFKLNVHGLYLEGNI